MKKLPLKHIGLFFVTMLLSLSINAATALELPTLTQKSNTKAILTPTPPTINAASYILIDANSGKVLAENESELRLPPASLAKIMTIYMVSEALKSESIHLSEKTKISKKAWRTEGSRMFIEAGKEVEVYDLIQGVVVQSGNDASVALAEHIAGTEDAFVDLMNQQAEIFNMKDTYFTNSTGLPDPDLYTSARDLAVLSQALISNHPEDYQWHKEKWFAYNGIRQPNRNRLLGYDGVDGIKTGYTEEAGFGLVTSAEKEGMRLIAVVLGAPSDEARTEDTRRLLAYGFRFFETEKYYQAQQPIVLQRTWQGQQKTVPVGLSEDLYLTIPKGQYKEVKATVDISETVYAPIDKNEIVGIVNLSLNDEVITSQPLIALASNQKGSLWTQISDSTKLRLKKWFG